MTVRRTAPTGRRRQGRGSEVTDACQHQRSRATRQHTTPVPVAGDVAPAQSQAKSRAFYQVYEQAIAVLLIGVLLNATGVLTLVCCIDTVALRWFVALI